MSASSLSWRRSMAGSRGRLLTAAVAACLLLLAALAMYLYDHGRRDLIANGVRVDGVAVGGMRESAALAKVQRQLAGSLDRPVTVRSGGRSWTLGAGEAALKV